MSPRAGGGNHLLGTRKCPGAMFQMGRLGRYGFIVNILLRAESSGEGGCRKVGKEIVTSI